jgi:hypothetical protein
MESLENRELMAANVTANVSGGVLNIQGTNGNDNVQVLVLANNLTRVFSGNRAIFETPTSSYSSMNANMLDGQDRLHINAIRNNQLTNVNVNMGRGSSEWAKIEVGSTRNLNVNAVQSVGTQVVLAATVVDQAIVDFGNDAGSDRLSTHSSSFNRFNVSMGAGADDLNLYRTSIQNSNINMGAGNDAVFMDQNSDIFGGFVDGGDGQDSYQKHGAQATRLTLRSIERRR